MISSSEEATTILPVWRRLILVKGFSPGLKPPSTIIMARGLQLDSYEVFIRQGMSMELTENRFDSHVPIGWKRKVKSINSLKEV